MRALDTKVRVQPVFAQLLHSAPYEGPCRVGRKEDLAPEAERERGKEGFQASVAELRANLSDDAELLEPAYLEWHDDFVLPESEIAKLAPDVYEADLVLWLPSGLGQYPAISVANRYGKPVGTLGWVGSIDIIAYLRSRGMEGYAFLDYEDLNRVLSLLRVRKAFRHTRFLVATEGNPTVPTGVVSSIWDLEGLRARYGVDHAYVSASDIIAGMDQLSEADEQEADELTAKLADNAQAVHMTRDDLLQSVRFYVATKRVLDKYEANAFVVPCFEVCAKQIMEQKRVTFCLTHSLLKDQGIPSACEADANVLMAIALLMYLSRKTAYMGNSHLVDREENILGIHHDVPGLKMKGLDAPDLPYEIRNFTMGGWGATLRYDFARDRGAPVTMARFDPTGRKVLVAKGEIAGGAGFDKVGCALTVHVKVRDIVDLYRKEMGFGHHLAMVYGDYVGQVRDLGEIMGFEVVEA
ncbi:MAG: hypothetical protein ACP5G7_04415 [Anaerolineae bacterium]